MPTITVAPPQYSRGSSVLEFDGVWWAVQTPPQREKQLARELIERGVDYYLPLERYKKLIDKPTKAYPHGRCYHTVLPVYPRFVFVNIDDVEEWYRVKESPSKSKMHEVKDQKRLINDLAKHERPIIEDVRQFPDLYIGGNVLIRAGAFQGQRGELVSMNNVEEIGAVQMSGLSGILMDLNRRPKHFPLSMLEVD